MIKECEIGRKKFPNNVIIHHSKRDCKLYTGLMKKPVYFIILTKRNKKKIFFSEETQQNWTKYTLDFLRLRACSYGKKNFYWVPNFIFISHMNAIHFLRRSLKKPLKNFLANQVKFFPHTNDLHYYVLSILWCFYKVWWYF